MKAYHILIILILIITVVALISLCTNQHIFTPKLMMNNTSIAINESNNVYTINSTFPIINRTVIDNTTINNCSIQSVDSNYVFNNVNWSKYPSIEGIAVHNYEITGPNTIINHTFVIFSIDVNIKNPNNTEEIYYELAGVVAEIRQKLGPNSSPDVWGLVNGVDSYNAVMLPYDDRIFVSDHYHPQAYKNDIYLIPGDNIYDYHNYTLINNSVIEP